MEMPKDLTEVTLRRKDVYDGKILKVHVDDVRLPSSRFLTFPRVIHGLSAAPSVVTSEIPSVIGGIPLLLENAPSLQWRDRAGFSPASILALGSFATYRGCGLPEDHKRLMYFLLL